MTAEQKYKDTFGLGSTADKAKVESALQQALDIRKFEIGLYWQRGTYFWTLIAVTFAGYFAVLSAEHMDNKQFNAYIIGCVGFIFSLAWFLSNRGSKYWQENWENHVDMLEDQIIGPLYKTILHRPKSTNLIVRLIEGPAPYSVSQINQWVSLFTIAVWVFLIFNVLPPMDQILSKHYVLAAITLAAALLMCFRARSNIVEGQKHSIAVRRIGIIDG